ncbi:MAG: PKD domain-containing protein [Nanoarchaeota archaeon]|nr:PKD domain-containing protein [Nanoarchaeota archaeon]MBU4116146.1 PKD domain-containing protein [Nanoarchaeota archaeon]
MRLKNLAIIYCLILVSVFVSADFEIGNLSHSINTAYASSDNIQGWINISLIDAPSNILFKDSFDNSISLINLLNKNNLALYSCNPFDCEEGYSAVNGALVKTFNLGAKESKILGFKFTGNIVSINSIEFNIQSNAADSCYNQLKIDFFDDGTIIFGNNKSSSLSCGFLKNYGCFDESQATTTGLIGINPYCQRIHLSESPGFKLGAWVQNPKNLIMILYDKYGNSINGVHCNLPNQTGELEVSCDINYLITEPDDYYVCIYSENNSGTSKIRGYSSGEGCGFQGYPVQAENTAYQIFAEGKRFANFGTLKISNLLENGNALGNLAKDYIWDNYKTLDCSETDCIIPVKFTSEVNQFITLSNLSIIYDLVGFSGTEEHNFYELNEISALINSNYQKLSLNEAGFVLPENYGNFTFELLLDNQQLFSEKIEIGSIPVIKSIIPTTTASAFPTLFQALVDNSNAIKKYTWDFGDNNIKITQTNEVMHSYNSTGKYQLKLTIDDLNQRSFSKSFNITVRTPEEEINKTLNEKLNNLINLNSQIEKFSSFYQESINAVLNLKEIEDKIKKIQRDYETASSEAEYNQIITELLEFPVPTSIFISKYADLISFYSVKDNIAMNLLEEITSRGYDKENLNAYYDSILLWNQNNIDAKINFAEISIKNDYGENSVVKIFEIEIDKKNAIEYDSYFFIKKLKNMFFEKGLTVEESLGYFYIKLKPNKETISFYTTENVGFSNLPAFIAPGLDKLVISVNETPSEDNKISKWSIFILIMFFLIIVGVIIYLILQEWYKKKYENHLFKNRNNLYNLITYIANSKNKGLGENDIIANLKKAKWNSEQITYVMRKYSGKRTGMMEFPIQKILDKFRKKQNNAINSKNNLQRIQNTFNVSKTKPGFKPGFHK